MTHKIILFILLFSSAMSYAETTISATETKKIISEVEKKFWSSKKITCQYIQTRTVSMLTESIKAEGKIVFFTKQKRLDWFLSKPNKQQFSLRNDSIFITKNNKTSALPIRKNLMFAQISKMIPRNQKLIDETNFNTTYFFQGNHLLVKLTPQKNRLKRFFSTINITVNKTTFYVQTIELIDGNKDVTKIEILNVKQEN